MSAKRSCIRKLASITLMVISFASFIGGVYAAALARGDVVYARSNLRADGSKMFWHNMRSFWMSIPVGAEVRIERSDAGLMTFITTDTKKTFYLYADSGQWDKYFVKNKKEIGLERIAPGNKNFVAEGGVVMGMTKEEVYVSKGCPAYIAWGKKTEKNSLNEILKSDKWYYMDDKFCQDIMVTFVNGVVGDYGSFEK